jgi:hypothetical protein
MLAFRHLRSGSSLLAQLIKPMSSLAVESAAEASKLQDAALHENCILVDENDKYLGQSSKRDCHRVSETGELKLHRAFSVFLFNSKGDMLVQRRTTHKVSNFLYFIFNLLIISIYYIPLRHHCVISKICAYIGFLFHFFACIAYTIIDNVSRLLHKCVLQPSVERYRR